MVGLYIWVLTDDNVCFFFYPLLPVTVFFSRLSCLLAALSLGGCLSRVLDEDFYKQPFSDLIGYVYVAPTNILLLNTFLFPSHIAHVFSTAHITVIS